MNARLSWERRGRRWTRQLLERFGTFGLLGISLLLLALGLAVYTPQLAREAEDLRGQTDRTRGRLDEVRRDLALLLDKSVSFADLEKLAYETEKQILKKIALFDVYEGDKIGPDKKSYALSFILQDENKTLKDDEIERVMNRLMKIFRERVRAEVR